ncbi:MAG: TonB-dependent receptor [Nitrospira sp.]|nr:TonB-dependent receptor [Nitrospira sp.]
MVCLTGLVSLLPSSEITFAANADPAQETPPELTALSLEELMKVEVTSVSKQAQPLFQAAAAIFVISQEDIRRSGVTTIPEALRMAPGIQVARLDTHRWAVSSRGFNGEFANKLLVLIDGRTAYSPLFSGVFWDAQDTVLEDIDRIEIIRGPGASLWGANAVNGVINVITKKAKDTQGLLAVVGGGTEERAFTTLRYGTSVGEHTHARLYGKFSERDDFVRSDGTPGEDDWRNGRGGFRLDHELSSRDSLTVQGDYYRGSEGFRFAEPLLTTPFSQSIRDRWSYSGGNVLSRWKHAFSDSSSLLVQTYYDRTERESRLFNERRDTFDIDLQHSFAWGQTHRVIWGLGYRFTTDHIVNSTTIRTTPTSRVLNLFNGFVQDEFTLIPNTLALTAGTKVEHNDFTGWVVQPSGRLRWTPTQALMFWGAISHAIRTPSRAEDDSTLDQIALPPNALFPGAPVALTTFGGQRGFRNESLLAYEIGTRYQPVEAWSIDISAFYNRYDRLRSIEPGTSSLATNPLPPHLLIPFVASNKLAAETHGVEVSSEWHPIDRWHLQATYSYLRIQMITGASLDPTGRNANGDSPQHQASLRSLMQLPGNIELDLWGRFVDRLPALNIPAYISMDTRLGWKPSKNVEVSIVGQNLLESRRPEFATSFVAQNGTEVQRGTYIKLTWRH